MKLKDLNKTQQKAYLNIKYAMLDYIGGYENQLLDNSPEDEDYQIAFKALTDVEAMTNTIYKWATEGYYCDELRSVDEASLIREINFCGKQFLMDCIRDNLNKWGFRDCYLAIIDKVDDWGKMYK